MPAASASAAGRPVPSNLEIQVIEKFMRFDAIYADQRVARDPERAKRAIAKSNSALDVSWIGLNQDPRKVKYLAKQGLLLRKPLQKRKPSSEEQVAPAAADAAKASTADVGYAEPSAPKPSGGAGGRYLVLGKSASGDSAALPPRRLSKISSACHFLEQTTGGTPQIPGVPMPGTSGMGRKPVMPGQPAVPEDLRELLYSGVTAEYDGRYAYLKARRALCPQDKFGRTSTSSMVVGWNLAGSGVPKTPVPKRYPPKPDTIAIT